jgi:hypothetical protein
VRVDGRNVRRGDPGPLTRRLAEQLLASEARQATMKLREA